jgi:tetratricopeptide (TPR) repeat protein
MPKKNDFCENEILQIFSNKRLSDEARRAAIIAILPDTFNIFDISDQFYENDYVSMTMARVLQQLGQHEDALFIYQRMLNPQNSHGIRMTKYLIFLSMGRCLQEMERYEEAKDCYIESERVGARGRADRALDIINSLIEKKHTSAVSRDATPQVRTPVEPPPASTVRDRMYPGFFSDYSNQEGCDLWSANNSGGSPLQYRFYGSSAESLDPEQLGFVSEIESQLSPDITDAVSPLADNDLMNDPRFRFRKYRYEPYSIDCSVIEYRGFDPSNGF